MNYVLPFQGNGEVKSLVCRRSRLVIDEVKRQVAICTRQSLGQSGFLSWSTTEGKSWGVFENGRCIWLLYIEGANERVCYYRYRGDLEQFELHEPGHAGNSVCQKVEQLGQLVHSYKCINGTQLGQLELKIRWFKAQRWFREIKSNWGFRKAA